MQKTAYNQLTEVFEKLNRDVFNELFNAEKNTYDPEIRLPKSEPHKKISSIVGTKTDCPMIQKPKSVDEGG